MICSHHTKISRPVSVSEQVHDFYSCTCSSSLSQRSVGFMSLEILFPFSEFFWITASWPPYDVDHFQSTHPLASKKSQHVPDTTTENVCSRNHQLLYPLTSIKLSQVRGNWKLQMGGPKLLLKALDPCAVSGISAITLYRAKLSQVRADSNLFSSLYMERVMGVCSSATCWSPLNCHGRACIKSTRLACVTVILSLATKKQK